MSVAVNVSPSDKHWYSVHVVILFLLFQIDHINLVMDNETGRSKGFGFVTVSIGLYSWAVPNFPFIVTD